MKIQRLFLSVISFIIMLLPVKAQLSSLQGELKALNYTNKCITGIGVMDLSSGDCTFINGDMHIPMQSVFKFHIALAVLSEVDSGRLSLNTKVKILPKELYPNTHSPLRDKYPKGNVSVPLSELIEYTVSMSDNIACDILLKVIGGPSVLDRYIKSLGIIDFQVMYDERTMGTEFQFMCQNWTTPRAAIQILSLFNRKQILKPATHEFLYNCLLKTNTAPKRMRAGIPKGAILAHKTGTGPEYFMTNKGHLGLVVVNDIGFIEYPNGKKYAVAIFIKDSHLGYDENLKEQQLVDNMYNATDQMIADITRVISDYALGR